MKGFSLRNPWIFYIPGAILYLAFNPHDGRFTLILSGALLLLWFVYRAQDLLFDIRQELIDRRQDVNG